MPFWPGQHLIYKPMMDEWSRTPGNDWYAKYTIDGIWGLDHCAARSLAFHYIDGEISCLVTISCLFPR